MAISHKTRYKIKKVIPFGIIFLVSSWVFLFVEYAVSGWQPIEEQGTIAMTPETFVFSSIAVTLVGLIIGTLEVTVFKRLFTKYSFSKKILFGFTFYLLFIFLIICFFYPLAGALDQDTTPWDPEILEALGRYISSVSFLSALVQISFSLILGLFYNAISDNLGQNVWINFFTGKYHTPQKEERVFMFLDMKDSTLIAEQLGHVKYFELLKAYYNAMSEAIINSYGEVYQYIGDEVVVSWPTHKGLLDSNCIRCFYAIKKRFLDLSSKFEANFGFVPQFKAGIHLGEVATGEIGALKTEIVFTGDVLNTTSRIQSLCNHYEEELLISGDLYQNIGASAMYGFKALGQIDLTGKSLPVQVFSVTKEAL